MKEPIDWRHRAVVPVKTEEEFVTFLNAVGICTWLALPRLDFPSLAAVMEPPKEGVMNATWFWKDDLHAAKRLFYGKLLGGNASFVSMAFLPTLIAARGDLDPYNLHEQGRLTEAALRIYEALQENRSLPTRDLRMKAKLAGTGDKTTFENGVTALTGLFQICKTEITGRTRGTYSYVWGMVEDWIPETLEAAARLRPQEAAQTVATHLADLHVYLDEKQWKRLFGWDAETIAAVRKNPV